MRLREAVASCALLIFGPSRRLCRRPVQNLLGRLQHGPLAPSTTVIAFVASRVLLAPSTVPACRVILAPARKFLVKHIPLVQSASRKSTEYSPSVLAWSFPSALPQPTESRPLAAILASHSWSSFQNQICR